MKPIHILLILSLVIKLILSAVLPLSSDESYYWVWGKNLQLSYFDHPPFIAWLFYLGTPFDSLGSAARWPGILMGHLTLYLWVQMAKPYLNLKQLFYFVLAYLLSPLLGFGSMVMTPDIPLLFFWTLSFLFLQKTVRDLDEAKSPFVNAFIMGGLLGLGFCSKYNIVVFTPLAIVYLAMSRKWNKNYILPIFISIVGFVIFSLPVLLWNYQNDFISFKFQTQHGLGGSEWQAKWTYVYVLGQILLLFPVLFYKGIKNTPSWKKNLEIIIFAWGPLVFFLMTSFKGHVEANWPLVAYPFFLLLVMYKVENFRFIKSALVFWSFLLMFIVFQVFMPTTSYSLKKLTEISEFNQTISFIEKNPKYLDNIFARNYQMAGKLSFAFKRTIPKLRGMNRIDFFDTFKEAYPKSNKFYLVATLTDVLPHWIEKEGFKKTSVVNIDQDYNIVEYIRE